MGLIVRLFSFHSEYWHIKTFKDFEIQSGAQARARIGAVRYVSRGLTQAKTFGRHVKVRVNSQREIPHQFRQSLNNKNTIFLSHNQSTRKTLSDVLVYSDWNLYILFYSKPIDRCRNNISFIFRDFNASDVLPIKMTHALRSFNFFIGLIEIKKNVSSIQYLTGALLLGFARFLY